MLNTIKDFQDFLKQFEDTTQVRIYVEVENSLFMSNLSITNGTIKDRNSDVPFIVVSLPDSAINYIHENM